MTEFVTTWLAGLAVLAQALLGVAALVLVAALVSPAAARLRDGVRARLAGAELWLAWLVAVAATLGSLYFSEVADYIPCRLCWFQRIAMYPLVVTLLVGALTRDRRGPLYSLPFPIIGALVSLRHLYIEANPEAESASCRIGAPCSTKWIDEFGYVTLPVLALTAFALVTLLLLLALRPPRAA